MFQARQTKGKMVNTSYISHNTLLRKKIYYEFLSN